MSTNVLIMTDSSEGTLSSEQAKGVLERGILQASRHQTAVRSVADGGKGSIHALATCIEGGYKTW